MTHFDNISYNGTDLCQIMWNELEIWARACNRTSATVICVEHIFRAALLSCKMTKKKQVNYFFNQKYGARVPGRATRYDFSLFFSVAWKQVQDRAPFVCIY